MMQPPNRQRGAAGATIAKYFFETLGWGVVETGDHDLGTDLVLQIRDEHLRDLALMMGAQIKTGDSYFDELALVDGQPGWIYREDDQRHANYWSNHPIPHIIVLQSEDQSTRAWAWLNRDTIENTGAGMKVFIPASQPLDAAVVDTWVTEAERALKRVALDGSRWTFTISSVPEVAHARYALLGAHLVAPHPNKHGAALGWEEAVSLCVLASAERWERAAAKHEGVPTVEEAAGHADWGWRLAAAIYAWVYKGEIAPLETLDSAGQPRGRLIAHAIVLSLALRGAERAGEIDALLTPLVVETEYSVDQAWLSVHLAYAAAERGDLDDAHALSERAMIQLAPVPGDVTASAVRAAAAWSLFDTRPYIAADLSPIVTALDTPTSWWRAQQVSAGLEAAVKRQYAAWSRDPTTVIGQADIPHNTLYSAALQARLAGSFSRARSISSLQGMIDLSTQRPVAERPLYALQTLIDAGDEKGIRNAIRGIAAAGPLKDLREFVDAISASTMTRTASRAALRAIQHAGIYASEEHATELIELLLSSLEDADGFRDRTAARYLVAPALLDALAGLSDFFRQDDWHRIVGLLVAWAGNPDETMKGTLERLVRDVVLDDDDQKRIVEALPEQPDWYRRILLSALGPDHSVARDETRRAIGAGDHRAVAALRTYDRMEPEEVAALGGQLSAAVGAYGSDSPVKGISLGGEDYAHQLARLSINFPDQGGWEALIAFFADSGTSPFRKRAAAIVLARHVDAIPDRHRAPLREAVSLARGFPDVDMSFAGSMVPEVGGALDCLLLALTEDGAPEAESVLLALLLGDRRKRTDLAAYLGTRQGVTTLLASLANDSDPETAAEATYGLARSLLAGRPDQAVVGIVTNLASQDRNVGLHIAAGLQCDDPLPSELVPIVETLRAHASVRVRRLADRIGARSSVE